LFSGKRIYQGRLVHRCEDELGLIEIVESASHRSLHFGTQEKQSAMDLKSPRVLVLSYTKAMMTGLLFFDSLNTVLNIGLGGGSIPKFIVDQYPECRIDVVELREKVVQVAYQYFELPRNPRLTIYISDIVNYFKSSRIKTYDLIVLDAFDQHGMSDSIKGVTFLNACRKRLNPGGILVVNLWSEPDTIYKTMTRQIFRCFDHQALLLPVAERSNQIVLGVNRLSSQPWDWRLMAKRAALLEPRFKIGLPQLLETLKRINQTRTLENE